MALKPIPGLDVPIARADPVTQTWYEYFQSLLRTITGYEAAWTSFTPAITASSGAFGSVSATGAYLAIGNFVNFTFTITITTVGTAANDIIATLPIGTAKRPASVVATESAVVGFMGFGRIATGASTINPIRKYDNSSYIGALNVITVTGAYERA